jgi:hypothetical protein
MSAVDVYVEAVPVPEGYGQVDIQGKRNGAQAFPSRIHRRHRYAGPATPGLQGAMKDAAIDRRRAEPEGGSEGVACSGLQDSPQSGVFVESAL